MIEIHPLQDIRKIRDYPTMVPTETEMIGITGVSISQESHMIHHIVARTIIITIISML